VKVMLVMRRLLRLVLLSGFALLFIALGTSSAYADGDDFFAFALGNAQAKIGFMGTVKDDQGNHLSGVSLTVVATAPSVDEADDTPIEVTFKTFTDIIGRYRSLNADDVVSVISGAVVTLKPEDLKLVGASKEGYTQIRRLDRSRAGQAMREIDFVMKKVDN
jgi:hypothetical protein